ncbi:hypothetical protein Taro_048216, partial [Colocasia esculenta]|nr:hypothetical protein [Colocasia esculenta]
CVDTIGFNYSDCFLGQSSSVDTQVDCVDTTGCFSQNMLLGQSASVNIQMDCVDTTAGRRISVALGVPDATVIRVAMRVCVAFLSRPGFLSHLGVAAGQRVATAFYPVGHLTLVRVAGVSVRPVALSRRPWGAHSCRGSLARRVKVRNAMEQAVAFWVSGD